MFIGFGKKKGRFLVNQTYLGLWMCIGSLILFGCSEESESRHFQTQGEYWGGSMIVHKHSKDAIYAMGEELDITLEYIGDNEDITNIEILFKDPFTYSISLKINESEFENNTIKIMDRNAFDAVYTINNHFPILIKWFEGPEFKEEEIYFE
ncbi:hypothetical protein RYX56_06485 [Alkalihalophilus lindianensis]|uniref:DUF4825 domain-containing protein n=1 Tax=Alkalihalophilus lindianensis TaxID=1630542 RepID=A0ABU3X9N0_9BACI|nr:hypothetical protein [Alkalihalophilus lindianensis]MDV2684018.1 hypothetical protein [Alkalihalophilus lindianensis]